jgi:hypothetical protein
VLLTLTKRDVFESAVQGCQPSSIAIERMFAEQLNQYVHAVQASPTKAYIFTMGQTLQLTMPPPLSDFNAAYYHGEITTLEDDIVCKV